MNLFSLIPFCGFCDFFVAFVVKLLHKETQRFAQSAMKEEFKNTLLF